MLAAALVLAAIPPLLAEAPAQRAASTFPEMVIRKGETAHEWPFAVDQGELTCIRYGKQTHVFFSEILTEAEQGPFGNMKLPRMVVVTANPVAYLVGFEDRGLYAPWDSLETLIRRLAPFERMGWELCDKGGEPLESKT